MKQPQDEGVFKHLKLSSKLKWGPGVGPCNSSLLERQAQLQHQLGPWRRHFPVRAWGTSKVGQRGREVWL